MPTTIQTLALLVANPAPREGPARVHMLGTGGEEEPTAESGGDRTDAKGYGASQCETASDIFTPCHRPWQSNYR